VCVRERGREGVRERDRQTGQDREEEEEEYQIIVK
jgi:hypothetical protein